MSAFSKGDHVEWNPEAGMIRGVAEAIHPEDALTTVRRR